MLSEHGEIKKLADKVRRGFAGYAILHLLRQELERIQKEKEAAIQASLEKVAAEYAQAQEEARLSAQEQLLQAASNKVGKGKKKPKKKKKGQNMGDAESEQCTAEGGRAYESSANNVLPSENGVRPGPVQGHGVPSGNFAADEVRSDAAQFLSSYMSGPFGMIPVSSEIMNCKGNSDDFLHCVHNEAKPMSSGAVPSPD